MVILTEISVESSSLSAVNYDVFLSFRGTDTRYNFTDHLHKALVEAAISTFLDDTEIQTGDSLKPELVTAIKSSRASVIVLSKDYASSTWCLDELALIMEQRRTSKHIVSPIFYHVKPSDVRKQRNSFGDAMAEHKHRMETELNATKQSQMAQKIEKWEKALIEVADIKGEEASGRRETMLIEGVVKELSSILELHKRSKLPHMIGMESSIRKVTSFLKDRSLQSTEILTIWGMAGIGKTYLASYVFKLHCLDFERSCFLEDIERRCTTPNGLLDVQKQLLKDMRARSHMDINNVNEGTINIENSLFMNRNLLVLDGINEVEQLDVLIGTKGLHPGSKIIITTKNGSLTEKCRLFDTKVPPKHTKHLLRGLNDKDSLQLLSWHAFGRNEPNEVHIKESMQVVKYCKGHPLALKVLGSSIRSEDVTWEDILESLGKEINPDIKKVLKISYDTLPSEKDKELFKHIACLFIGEDRKFTEDILKACGICKSSGVKILINRCLLTVDSFDKLTMHQLLQEMGRDIVRQESPTEPWKRSILWHHDECLAVLQNRQGTHLIQALVLDTRTFDNKTSKESSSANMQKFGFRSFPLIGWVHILLSFILWLFGWASGMRSSFHKTKGETLALSGMRNLRLLQLNYVQLSGSYKNFPQGLRWLCMHGFPLRYIPSDLQMENMVALDLSNSKLRRLWKKPKLLRSLKFLNLSNCHGLVSVGHFSCFPVLERLVLARCTSLVEVCESIGYYCHKLEVLGLNKCNKLKKLPGSIGKLKDLKLLSIFGCSSLSEVPCEIKDMESLEVLEAGSINIESVSSSFVIVEAIPRSYKTVMISLPSSLVKLSLKNNNLCNDSFPKDFSSLSMLKKLNIGGNRIDSLPDCVRSLTGLEELVLNNCHRLKTVLLAPNSIKRLATYYCIALEEITFNPEKSAPPEVDYFDFSPLTNIQDKPKMNGLAKTNEKVLRSLGCVDIDYLKYYMMSMAGCNVSYAYTGKILKPQVDVSFTLKSSRKYGKIHGLNLCIISTISSLKQAGPSIIKVRNLTKKCSWEYEPLNYATPETNEGAMVWLRQWMLMNNEFEDGDEISILVSENIDYETLYCEGPDSTNVREYGISHVYPEDALVYDDDDEDDDDDDDDDDDSMEEEEEELGYYKSWKHIIGGDPSAVQLSPSCHLLKQRRH